MTKIPGFSLIELILAFGILAVLATTSTVILSATLRSSARAAASSKVRNEGEYLVESIFQMLRYAHGVNCTAGTTTLNMAKKNPSDGYGPRYTCGANFIASNSGILNANEQLNSTDTTISSCAFTCSPTAANPTQVNVSFAIQDVAGLIDDPLIFDTNIILRNSE